MKNLCKIKLNKQKSYIPVTMSIHFFSLTELVEVFEPCLLWPPAFGLFARSLFGETQPSSVVPLLALSSFSSFSLIEKYWLNLF